MKFTFCHDLSPWCANIVIVKLATLPFFSGHILSHDMCSYGISFKKLLLNDEKLEYAQTKNHARSLSQLS